MMITQDDLHTPEPDDLLNRTPPAPEPPEVVPDVDERDPDEECNAKGRCNRPKGHDGLHGIVIGDGLLLAPWSGPSGDEVSELCDIACDSCGAAMRLTRTADGAEFDCTKCHQEHWFGRDGSHSQISCTLWVDPEKQNSEQRSEALRGMAIGYRFAAQCRLIGGILNRSEYEEAIAYIETRLQAELLKLQPLPSWWSRLLKSVGLLR